MNPSPHSSRPFNPPPRLIDTRLSPPGYVPVTVTRGFPVSHLEAIEAVWAPEREQLVADLREHGETLESGHWDWRNKIARQPHWHTLVVVECDGQVQGIMAVENFLRPSRLSPSEWVLYLDYVEVAP
ncbi:unnamed protein product [Gemmata massiliana]|uniref:Uncharacterized protein n=1 Tax=Gemmata massiliana TaxID=1210884 RepID=A0A6P2D5Y0_9BACT|nr:unnamed protein product [Gemmata massiliana]